MMKNKHTFLKLSKAKFTHLTEREETKTKHFTNSLSWVGGIAPPPTLISTRPEADDDMAVHFHHRKRAEQCNRACKTQQICYGRI